MFLYLAWPFQKSFLASWCFCLKAFCWKYQLQLFKVLCSLVNYCKSFFNNIFTSSTRTRRGGSYLKDIYETFLIYRTCMRRAPAKPVRACTLRKLCPASHVTLEARRHTSHLTIFTLHTAPFAVNTSHFSLHIALSPIHTSHSTLHTSQSTLLTSHFTLHTSHCTLHAAHFTLHSSHSTLHLI